jgi:formylglycine-generating enzyme required for sulfatase activity
VAHYYNVRSCSSAESKPNSSEEIRCCSLLTLVLGSANVWGEHGTAEQRDPLGPDSGSFRVCRGGSWDYSARFCRSAYRLRGLSTLRSLNLGFRFAAGQ